MATNLHLRMIRRNTKAHQAIWNWQLLVHIYVSILYFREHFISGIETSWSGADDCNSERSAIVGSWVAGVAATSYPSHHLQDILLPAAAFADIGLYSIHCCRIYEVVDAWSSYSRSITGR